MPNKKIHVFQIGSKISFFHRSSRILIINFRDRDKKYVDVNGEIVLLVIFQELWMEHEILVGSLEDKRNFQHFIMIVYFM